MAVAVERRRYSINNYLSLLIFCYYMSNIQYMKFKINHIPSNDYIIVEGESLTEIREKVFDEMFSRNWHSKDCFSEMIDVNER